MGYSICKCWNANEMILISTPTEVLLLINFLMLRRVMSFCEEQEESCFNVVSKMRNHTGPKEIDFNFYFPGDFLKCKKRLFLVIQSKVVKKNIIMCLSVMV